MSVEQTLQVLRDGTAHAEQRGGAQLLRYLFSDSALAYNDPNSDGAVIVQREVGDNLIILTVFAMQI